MSWLSLVRGKRAAEAVTSPPSPEPVPVVAPPEAAPPTVEPKPVTVEHLPPGQRRVRMGLDEVLARRGYSGALGGFRQKLGGGDGDPRPDLARRAGYGGDVLIPRLDD